MAGKEANQQQSHTKLAIELSFHEEAIPASGILSSSVIWVGAYFLVNLSLTLYNKVALQAFSYPWLLTALHASFTWAGSHLAEQTGFSSSSQQNAAGWKETLVLVAYSVLYTVNIAVSNVSLQMVSVPLHQVINALTPFFSITISTILFSKTYPLLIWFSLCVILVGVGLATSGDYSASTIGVLMTLLGAFLASVKGLATNRILVGNLRLPPLQLLKRMSPLACVQCLVLAHYTGELQGARESLYLPDTNTLKTSLLCALLFNGLLAFIMNVVSFNANKKVGNLALDVAANIKKVTTVVLAVFVFNLNLGLCNTCGIVISLIGGALYSYGNCTAEVLSKPQYTPLAKVDKGSPAETKEMDWEVTGHQVYSSGSELSSRRPSVIV